MPARSSRSAAGADPTIRGPSHPGHDQKETARIDQPHADRDADARKDWTEKTTTSLTRRFGELIVIEDLRVANMVRSGPTRRQNVAL